MIAFLHILLISWNMMGRLNLTLTKWLQPCLLMYTNLNKSTWTLPRSLCPICCHWSIWWGSEDIWLLQDWNSEEQLYALFESSQVSNKWSCQTNCRSVISVNSACQLYFNWWRRPTVRNAYYLLCEFSLWTCCCYWFSVVGGTVTSGIRLESNSMHSRIQCSEDSAFILQEQDPQNAWLVRGSFTTIKGHEDVMHTYWVHDGLGCKWTHGGW